MAQFEPQVQRSGVLVDAQAFLQQVYLWMAFGLTVTFATALLTVNSGLVDLATNRAIFWIAIFVELGLVVAISAGIRRMTPEVAGMMFIVYAAVNGFTLSIIFLVYDVGSVLSALAATAVLFGSMSIFGYVTDVDLTKYRSYFMIGLFGLLGAIFINWIVGSSALETAISVFGVLLFTGLTAYDTQKLVRIANDPELQADGTMAMRLSVLGALTLYLDFVNLFLFLLRLSGSRR